MIRLAAVIFLLLLVFLCSALFPARLSTAAQTNNESSSTSSETVESLLSEGDRLRAEQTKSTNEQAIQRYVAARNLALEANRFEEAARAIRNAGELSHLLGETQIAVNYYEEGLTLSRKARSPREEGRVRNDLSYLQFLAGKTDEAHKLALTARKLGEQIGDNTIVAQALTNIGEAYYNLGDLKKAVDYQQQALTIFRQLGDARGQSQAHVALGYCYSNLGEPAKAQKSYEEASTLSASINDQRGHALVLIAVGYLKAKIGERQEALDAFNEARSLVERIGDRTSRAIVLGGTGNLYFTLGDTEKALQDLTESSDLFAAAGERWGQAEAKLILGRIYHAMGRQPEALKYLSEAADLFKQLSITRLEAWTLIDLGRVYKATNDKQKAFDSYRKSLELLKSNQDQQQKAYALNYLGQLYEDSQNYVAAFDQYHHALPLSETALDPVGQMLSLHNIARLLRNQGHLEEARREIERAIEIIESQRAKVTSQELRASYFATVLDSYNLYIDILMLLHEKNQALDYLARAFNVSERARARSFLELLQESQAEIREGVEPSLIERERSIHAELNLKAERQMKLLQSKEKAEAEELTAEIKRLTRDYEQVEAEIKSQSPHYAALKLPQPLESTDAQRMLDNDTILMEYALGKDRSYVWLITKNDISAYQLTSREEIDSSARRLHNLFVESQLVYGESVEQHQQRVARVEAAIPGETALLSRLTLAPLAGKLGNKRLLIVADGALQYIPFQSLLDPDSIGVDNQLLLVRHEIVNQLSASTLAVLLKDRRQNRLPPNTVAVFADPVFEIDDPRIKRLQTASTPESEESKRVRKALRDVGLSVDGVEIPRLLSSRQEAEAIMNYAPWGSALKAVGFDANRHRVLSAEVTDYSVLHFATHGMINNDHPELSGIVLSLFDEQGRSQDGFLRLHDIYNLRLPADLVVLSACSTGLGKDVRGEGLIGLTRGFMYAGASSVVASLWKVDDEATAELMKHFYDGMFTRGLTPAAALREAQLKMSRDKRWHAPYYWAGFIIQGRYDEQVVDRRSRILTPTTISIALGLLAILIITSIVLVRRRRA